jgi:hypothetical protein
MSMLPTTAVVDGRELPVMRIDLDPILGVGFPSVQETKRLAYLSEPSLILCVEADGDSAINS